MERDRGDDEIERAIMNYFRDHPHAMDTVEGILDWWLNGARRRIDMAAVARVLRDLVDRGMIDQVGSDPNARYRVRRLSNSNR
jgi:hypothetical protein